MAPSNSSIHLSSTLITTKITYWVICKMRQSYPKAYNDQVNKINLSFRHSTGSPEKDHKKLGALVQNGTFE